MSRARTERGRAARLTYQLTVPPVAARQTNLTTPSMVLVLERETERLLVPRVMIAPYKDPAYSRVPLEEFKALTGVDGSAAVLTTKYVVFPRDTAGMGKYLEFLDADKLVQEDFAKAEANEMSARDLAARAQKVLEDAKIGTQGL